MLRILVSSQNPKDSGDITSECYERRFASLGTTKGFARSNHLTLSNDSEFPTSISEREAAKPPVSPAPGVEPSGAFEVAPEDAFVVVAQTEHRPSRDDHERPEFSVPPPEVRP